MRVETIRGNSGVLAYVDGSERMVRRPKSHTAMDRSEPGERRRPLLKGTLETIDESLDNVNNETANNQISTEKPGLRTLDKMRRLEQRIAANDYGNPDLLIESLS